MGGAMKEPSIFDNDDSERVCTYCKQPKTNHALTCLYGGMDAKVLDYATPAAQLLRKWKDEPDTSVWKNYKRDDLGNPVLSFVPRGPNAEELNSGSLIFGGEPERIAVEE